MPSTDRRHGRFFWVLDWGASRCSHKFCEATADDRRRKFHHGACDPRAKRTWPKIGCNQAFFLNKVTLQLYYYKAQLQVLLVHRGRVETETRYPEMLVRASRRAAVQAAISRLAGIH